MLAAFLNGRQARWFLAEIAVVVVGVLIALGMNAWWEWHRDRSAERTYLRGIVTDLDSTSTSLRRTIRSNERALQSIANLIVATGKDDVVPHDSLVVWVREVQFVALPTYSMGSARALVATGDLNLIRSDSVRLAISRVLDYVDKARDAEKLLFDLMGPPVIGISRRTVSIDLYRDLRRLSSPRSTAVTDTLLLRKLEGIQDPLPADLEKVLRNADSVRDLMALFDATQGLISWRKRVLDMVGESRERISSEGLIYGKAPHAPKTN